MKKIIDKMLWALAVMSSWILALMILFGDLFIKTISVPCIIISLVIIFMYVMSRISMKEQANDR